MLKNNNNCLKCYFVLEIKKNIICQWKNFGIYIKVI